MTMMDVVFATQAKEDRAHWEKTDQNMLKRIDQLIAGIQINPFIGIGKPEALKFNRSEYWSRRINQEHRLVYKIAHGTVYIAQCRYHY